MQIMKLYKENKDRWVAALRSGKYKQGDGTLYNPETESHCCLGVLCEAVLDIPRDAMESRGLPDEVGLKIPVCISLSKPEPEINRSSTGPVLFSALNDIYGASFEKIADIIERDLETYDIPSLQERMENDIPHHPKSLELFQFLARVDFYEAEDYFCWKVGGDGDNGEMLLYQLDAFFDRQDALKEQYKPRVENGEQCASYEEDNDDES